MRQEKPGDTVNLIAHTAGTHKCLSPAEVGDHQFNRTQHMTASFAPQSDTMYVTRWWRTHGILTVPTHELVDVSTPGAIDTGRFRLSLPQGRSTWLKPNVDMFTNRDAARGDVIRRKAALIARLSQELNAAYDIDTLEVRRIHTVVLTAQDCADADRG